MSEKQAKTVQSLNGDVDALMQWFIGRAGAEGQNMTDPDELRQLLWTLQQFVHAVSNELLVLTDDEPAELGLERVR